MRVNAVFSCANGKSRHLRQRGKASKRKEGRGVLKRLIYIPTSEWIISAIIKSDTVTIAQRRHSKTAAICLCFTPLALRFTLRSASMVSCAGVQMEAERRIVLILRSLSPHAAHGLRHGDRKSQRAVEALPSNQDAGTNLLLSESSP